MKTTVVMNNTYELQLSSLVNSVRIIQQQRKLYSLKTFHFISTEFPIIKLLYQKNSLLSKFYNHYHLRDHYQQQHQYKQLRGVSLITVESVEPNLYRIMMKRRRRSFRAIKTI